jgi:hypothetical protein
VAFGDKIGRPSWSSIWRVKKVCASLRGACDEDNWQRRIISGRMRGELLDVKLPCHSNWAGTRRVVLLFDLSRAHTQHTNIMTDREIRVPSTDVQDFALWNDVHQLRVNTSRIDILRDSIHHQHERMNDAEARHDLTTSVGWVIAV